MLAIGRRNAYFGSLTLLFLAACSSDGGSGPPSSSPSGQIVVTPSVSGTVTVMSGASETLSIPFNASESVTLSNLTVTGLASLPAGWSAPSAFTCTAVNTGDGCVLNMTFAPTGATSGTLTLSYTYSDGSGAAQSGSLIIPYSSTTNNNVVASASPGGQVAVAASSGSQAVAVTFDTDDGNPATSVTLTTDLSALPPGWSSTATSFGCPTVSTGNGCQLPLTYAPTAFGSGTLTLNFSYVDDSGNSKSGTLNIPYSATTDNGIVAASAPSGQVNAVVAAGSQSVILTFTTDDGHPATAFAVTTPLASLPAGWTSNTSTLACASVSAGNGCQLTLGYAPVAVGSGTLQIGYGYRSNSGAAKTGSVTIPYASTKHDNVAASVSPSGQIIAVVNSGSQAVQVTFGTDDGNVATSLTLTSPLNALPAGWSTTAQNFSCTNLSTGNGCQLGLVYAPGAAGAGTLALAFSYVDNAGTQKTGTVSIPYAATTHDNVTGAVAPSGPLNVLVNTSQSVNVTFATDDGLTATDLSIAPSVLSSLPAAWTSGGSSFSCSAVSTGSGCQLALTFGPTAVGSGSLSLPYSYTDNAGSAKTGTVTIPYASANPHAYIADPNSSPYLCSINSDGTLSGCTSMGLAFDLWDLAFNGNTVYISNLDANDISICSVAADGTFSNCTSGGSNMNGPSQIAIQGSHLYVANAGGGAGMTVCSIDASSGALSNCTLTSSVGPSRGIATVGNYAYLGSSQGGSTIDVCSIDGTTGLLSNCAATTQSAWYWLTSANGYLYTSQGAGVGVCSLSIDGSLSACATSTIAAGISQIWAVTISGSRAYVTAETSGAPPFFSTSFDVYLCSVSPLDGALSNCAVSDGGAYPYFLLHVLIH